MRKYSVLSPKKASRYCPMTKVQSIATRSTRPSRFPSFLYSFGLAFGWSFAEKERVVSGSRRAMSERNMVPISAIFIDSNIEN